MSSDATPPRGFSPRRLLGFLGREWLYLLLAPVVVVFGTVLHEGAHAAAVLAQGGEVTKVVVLPNMDRGHLTLGYVKWQHTGSLNEELVGIAPSLLSLGLALLIGLLLFRAGASVLTRMVMILGYMLPLVDVSQSCSNLMLGAVHSDWHKLFEGQERTVVVLCVGIAAVFLLLGWRVFLQVWGRDRLSFAEFALGFALVLFVPWSISLVR